MAKLTKDAQQEAQFQIFIGEEKDSPGVTDPVDWALGGRQQIEQSAFRNARQRVAAGQTTMGSLQRIGARAIFGFVGIPLNAARASIWYSPLAAISWANYLAHKSGTGYKDGNPYARSLGNDTPRKLPGNSHWEKSCATWTIPARLSLLNCRTIPP